MVMLSDFSDDIILGISLFDRVNILNHLLHIFEQDIESVTERSLNTAIRPEQIRMAFEAPPFRFFCSDRLFLITIKEYINLGSAIIQP
jgi:hypothetical protein